MEPLVLKQFYQCLLLASSRDKHFTSFTFSAMYINRPASVRWRLVVSDHSKFCFCFLHFHFPPGITQCWGSGCLWRGHWNISVTTRSLHFLTSGSWEWYSKAIMEKFNLHTAFLNAVLIHRKFPVLWAIVWQACSIFPICWSHIFPLQVEVSFLKRYCLFKTLLISTYLGYISAHWTLLLQSNYLANYLADLKETVNARQDATRNLL